MNVNGTLINYYFHCKRQCYLAGNRINLEHNSEFVAVGKALHEEKAKNKKNTEIFIDNIRIDKMTEDYVIEIKKSDADIESAKWQLLYYLKVLKSKGIEKKGKLEFIENNKTNRKTEIIELTEKSKVKLDDCIERIENLIQADQIPPIINSPSCIFLIITVIIVEHFILKVSIIAVK